MNIARGKVENYAKSVGLTGALKNIKIVRKTDTGRATNLTIKTAKETKTVPCGRFRLATGIRSCKITKLDVRKKDVHFEGKGYGHGIGMCQDGANGMAKNGKNSRKILKNYSPGAEITPLRSRTFMFERFKKLDLDPLIAKQPATPRDSSRQMVLHRDTHTIEPYLPGYPRILQPRGCAGHQ